MSNNEGFRDKHENEDWDSYEVKCRTWWDENWRSYPVRHGFDEFPPKWVHQIRATPKLPTTTGLDKQWQVSYDEDRDLGYDDQRDWFIDGPGPFGWSYNNDDTPELRKE